MNKLVILIDPGHGKETLGKRSPDETLREYEFNRDVARRLHKILLSLGIDARLTVTDDKDIPLITRTNQAKKLQAQGYQVFFLSIHANAFGSGWNSAHGIETFTNKFAESIAAKIQSALIKATGLTNRGVKQADLHITRETAKTDIPACLVELGFMTNKEECELLKTPLHRAKCANALAESICHSFNIKYPQSPQKSVDNHVDNSCKIIVNGSPISTQGFIENNKSYVPARKIAEAIGKGSLVGWCSENSKVILDDKMLESTKLVNNTGFVWSKEVAEALGLHVTWDADTKTVKLQTG